jgi:hypothetical protein
VRCQLALYVCLTSSLDVLCVFVSLNPDVASFTSNVLVLMDVVVLVDEAERPPSFLSASAPNNPAMTKRNPPSDEAVELQRCYASL